MKVIALIDPHSGGHHIAFMRFFVQVLIEKGYKVIVFHQNTEQDLLPWVKTRLGTVSELFVEDFDLQHSEPKFYGRFNSMIKGLNYWRQISRLIKRKERQLELKIDVVFFAWLDTYLVNYLHPLIVRWFFPYKWSGLYFHPRHMRLSKSEDKPVGISGVDVVLTSKNCLGIAIHDRGIVEQYKRRLLGKKIVVFPEIADGTPPKKDLALVQRIKLKARDRSVTGIIGLSKQQGLMLFKRLSEHPNLGDFFFAFIGLFNDRDMTQEEKREWQIFVNSKPENCLFEFGRIEEGADYNAVFCALDFPFLVYQEFSSTSNRLTKAAIFEKPVIATEKYCIGEDVKSYGLGITTSEVDVEICAKDLISLKDSINNGKSGKAQFQAYAELNSIENLGPSFDEILCL
ncbi:MAG: hypothetical protein O2887_10915 [Bacteroidetes bacterium]|nr:hypothetical protein [Bacteroidota bacterium]MDA1120981.1 hypothetical protein [Bacteroidota bacterium]